MNDTQKPAKSTTAKNKTSGRFTAEERAAMKERARQLKAERAGQDGERKHLRLQSNLNENEAEFSPVFGQLRLVDLGGEYVLTHGLQHSRRD